jgi:hypothetical protein
VALLALAGLAIFPAAPAFADKAKVDTSARAWYWETQKTTNAPNPTGGDAATVEVPNPFCPNLPGGLGNVPGVPGTEEGPCREGRLPVEVVGGDYETPDKISALAWDFFVVPIGAKVTKFEVTLDEASDPQSAPVNADGKRIQACMLNQFFGDGEARTYKEAPKFTCKKSDPVAERKRIPPKKDGGDPTFEWTFDLTKFAQVWAKGTSPIAGVMFFPAKPKNPNSADNADWRTVFTGPKDEGVHAQVVYTMPKPVVPPGGGNGNDDDDVDDGDDGSAYIPPATGTDGSSYDPGVSSDSGTSDFGTTADPVATDTGTDDPVATTDDPVEAAPDAEQAAAVTPEVEDLPGYVWLAILAGFIGFSLIKRTVLESATGIRPDGVLAQIRQMNAERRGTSIAAEAASSGGIGQTLKALGGKAGELFGKVTSLGRKG